MSTFEQITKKNPKSTYTYFDLVDPAEPGNGYLKSIRLQKPAIQEARTIADARRHVIEVWFNGTKFGEARP